jgi:hypothetical protein
MLKLLKMSVREDSRTATVLQLFTAFYCGLKRGIELTAGLLKGRHLRDSKYSS